MPHFERHRHGQVLCWASWVGSRLEVLGWLSQDMAASTLIMLSSQILASASSWLWMSTVLRESKPLCPGSPGHFKHLEPDQSSHCPRVWVPAGILFRAQTLYLAPSSKCQNPLCSQLAPGCSADPSDSLALSTLLSQNSPSGWPAPGLQFSSLMGTQQL